MLREYCKRRNGIFLLIRNLFHNLYTNKQFYIIKCQILFKNFDSFFNYSDNIIIVWSAILKVCLFYITINKYGFSTWNNLQSKEPNKLFIFAYIIFVCIRKYLLDKNLKNISNHCTITCTITSLNSDFAGCFF